MVDRVRAAGLQRVSWAPHGASLCVIAFGLLPLGCLRLGFESLEGDTRPATELPPEAPSAGQEAGAGSQQLCGAPDGEPCIDCNGPCEAEDLPQVATLDCSGSGGCVIAGCEAGFADCDTQAANGCETSLSGLEHCGSCGNACSASQATMACVSGACEIASCEPLFDDCDGAPENGCERALTTLSDCGACGVTCAASQANVQQVQCGAGACAIASCVAGYDDCDGVFENGCETSLSGLEHCGSCGNACSASQATMACVSGACEIASCEPLFDDCDGAPENGCERALTTLSDCGACGVTCAASQANVQQVQCGAGACAIASCVAGYDDCDGVFENGCETSLSGLEHCGSCGNACSASQATMACVSGACEIASCEPLFDDCDGAPENGCERALTTLSDCGACGVACRPAQATGECSTGVCSLASCDSGYGDCDGAPENGCETPLDTLSDCGSCGAVCTVQSGTAACAGGVCSRVSCDAGFADCDGDALSCETSLSTVDDCGACDAPCGSGGRLANADASCSSGSCAIAQCDSGFGDCDGEPSTGCETSLSTVSNCGACGQTCEGSQQCSAGECQGFEFTPSNLPPSELDFTGAPSVSFNCGATHFDSDSLSFSNACAGASPPSARVIEQTGGGQIVLLLFDSFDVASSSSLRLTGSRPVALAASGDATIAGELDTSAVGTTPGAGGNQSCAGSDGSAGANHAGGGGGGFGTAGAPGGTAYGVPGGDGGASRGNSSLSPLLGGCAGGAGGGCARAGAGGGALQLAVAGQLQVTGSVLARGAEGGPACGAGGMGGGSGGGILLEAAQLAVSGVVGATGGSGSSGWTVRSGSGGNGGAGRVRLRGVESCSIGGSVSPAPSTSCP